EGLLRENQVLAEKVEGPLSGRAPTGVTAPGGAGTGLFSSAGPRATSGPRGTGGEFGSAGDGPGRAAVPGGGGRSLSRAAGGDPTAVGQAQEVGNLHLGRVPLKVYYDFDNAGFHVA